MSTKKKQKQSLIDELIELKFPKREDRTPEKVNKFISDLINEVTDILDEIDEDHDSESDDNDNLPDGVTQRIQDRDDFPNNMIPFVVLKKDTTFIDYKCPHCSQENKFSIKKFDKTQYQQFTCLNCSKDILVKLEFEPTLRIFSENK